VPIRVTAYAIYAGSPVVVVPAGSGRRWMVKKGLAVALIFGFLLVDFLFFHDVFKAGETVTFPQYLTGVLSLPVIAISALFLLRGDSNLQTPA
jgi:hypothetical protein